MEIVNPRIRACKDTLARSFRSSDPFPHVVIPDLFSPEIARRLLDDFPSFEDRFARDEMGNVGRKAVHKRARDISDAYRLVDDAIQRPEFLELMSGITGIPELLYDSEYHGGGTHENVDGASLYTHVDFNYHPKGWHRRLNLIVYLSPEWKEEWGGCLELHSNPWDPPTDHVRTLPIHFNCAVLFETTERSWHGFKQIRLPDDRRHLSRKSFAIYLYTINRPADQTAASHSTIYVPFGMPEDVGAGSILTPQQYDLITARFNEYRAMLKLQYDRQLRLSEDFEAGYRLDLQGFAVQTRAPVGRWSDTWVSSDFRMEFRPTKRVFGVLLRIAVPREMPSDQVLDLEAGTWRSKETVHAGDERTIRLPLMAESGETVHVAIRAATTWSPGGADTRELAYRLVSAALEHKVIDRPLGRTFAFLKKGIEQLRL
jgi:2OG-Fe(II) oxygenase superfamily